MTEHPRLLIVDDEPDTCENLSDIFSDLGYRVDVAHDGAAALELVNENSYDLALLDLKMPGMSGLELYREIRRRSSGTAAIIVTAHVSGDTARSALEAGAWGIIPKPVNFADLHRQVDEVLARPLVLIVDDDPELCQSLWDLFREQRYRVSTAHDEGAARRMIGAHDYDVVLIDMKLPDADGTKVLAAVRQENPAARTLIITGFAAEMSAPLQQALAAGADAVCYKPFDVAQLLQTIERLTR
ncbi:MAG: response regulator [Pirellulales bacterium]